MEIVGAGISCCQRTCHAVSTCKWAGVVGACVVVASGVRVGSMTADVFQEERGQ